MRDRFPLGRPFFKALSLAGCSLVLDGAGEAGQCEIEAKPIVHSCCAEAAGPAFAGGDAAAGLVPGLVRSSSEMMLCSMR